MLPPEVLPPLVGVVDPPLLAAPVMAVAFFRVASRFRDLATRVPVARARSFTPLMFLVTENSSSEAEPPLLFLMPREKIARSSIFTFLPSSRSSLIHEIMSVKRPLMTPFE